MNHSRVALAVLTLLAAPAAAAQESPGASWIDQPRDWSETLRADATALHAAIIDSHPGVYDSLNPEFRARVDAGLAVALERAAVTTDAGGWWWALRAFTASFDDGHVQINLKAQGAGFPTRWPGFLTVRDGAEHVVASRDETDASVPPAGARLVDCDGVPADRLAAERIGAFRGRWFLESQQALFSDWLFMNASNPWTPEMRSCRFSHGGETETYALNWRRIEPADLSGRRNTLAQRPRPEFGLRVLDGGAVWMSLPSFYGAPGSDAHTALVPLLADAADRQAALRSAPRVVLDLRGNGGGSSHWSREIALILWGEEWVRAHTPPPVEAIEWRTSDANLAVVQGYLDEWTAAGESAERIGWARENVEGMTAARAAGLPYWRDGAEVPPAAGEPGAPPAQPMAGPVYVLTDPVCSSACLDAVDLWKAMGAVQIGRETSADTVYMDVREEALPSGLAGLVIPMKVWRGRPRGNNEPQRPAHVFAGPMGDAAALEAWVRTLP